ncbi:hypothetical protein KIN20_022962 [Parelaphostrongylus tenuis]|uniref:Uncharacterized protein n=1 Tax=Parelaphostrongylus tenuis TaxID=148309 RepID=A0AAD5N8J0_PARTN|nr:hypothetical protein KIN20_022962 [Parelaphostrongylus tenuis]
MTRDVRQQKQKGIARIQTIVKLYTGSRKNSRKLAVNRKERHGQVVVIFVVVRVEPSSIPPHSPAVNKKPYGTQQPGYPRNFKATRLISIYVNGEEDEKLMLEVLGFSQ